MYVKNGKDKTEIFDKFAKPIEEKIPEEIKITQI